MSILRRVGRLQLQFYGHLQLYSSDKSVFEGKTQAGWQKFSKVHIPAEYTWKAIRISRIQPFAAEHNVEGALDCPHIHPASYTHPLSFGCLQNS